MAQVPSLGKEGQEPSGPTVERVAMVLAAGVPIAAMVSLLAGLLAAFGVTVPVVQAALYLVLRARRAIPSPSHPGAAVQATLRTESFYRAAYLVNAAVRLQNAANATGSLQQAMLLERRYHQLHLQAQANRRAVAERVDRVGRAGLAGWRSVMDARTSPECAAADGRNFDVAHPPVIGYPGTVHLHCRCKAVAPFPGAPSVDAALTAMPRRLARLH